MNEPRHAMGARDSHIWTLRMALTIAILFAATLAGLLYTKQNDFHCHIPPDLSRGSTIKPGELQASNAYAFASYIWRGINDWSNDGKKDYSANITIFQCYVTPTFLQWIKQNEKEKLDAGELARTRTLSIDGSYSEDMSHPIGNNVFEVALTTKVHEHIEGVPIKAVIVRYPLRVVPDTRSCNVMGMALDGFYAQPERTEAEHVMQEKK